MKAKTLDRRFDEGKDVTPELDLATKRRPTQEQRRVNVDFPAWMIDSLDDEAARLGGHAPINHQGLDRGTARAQGVLS